MESFDPASLLRPRRRIVGMSAVLLPFTTAGAVDWPAFEAHVARTAEAGLVPAVNMDTGYVHHLEGEQRGEVLQHTKAVMDGGSFVAGAFVGDRPGDAFDLAGYRAAMDAIEDAGGTPVVFPSYGLAALDGVDVEAAFDELGKEVDALIGFELSPVFHPAGRIWDLDTYGALLANPKLIGAKHSSLRRAPEWDRLRLRDEVRPDFMVLTGNDLAIDMVMYGSDYLLGLSTFAPDLFAARDAAWAAGDHAAFHDRNDALQHLGNIAFRDPVPAYRHDAALFLRLRGWISSDVTPAVTPQRPVWEEELLRAAGCRLGVV